MIRVPTILQSPLAITAVGITAMGIAALLTVAACDPTSASSSGGSGQVTALCSLAGPPSPSATPPQTIAAGTAAQAPRMVGVILADTTSSTRYTRYEAPLWQKAFDVAGTTWDIQDAHGDTVGFEHIAQSMIAEGVGVLIIDPIDLASGIAVGQEADAAGVQVIDSDRLDLGGSAPCYVAFDDLEDGTS